MFHRGNHDDVVGLSPSPLAVCLADATGVRRIARTLACERTGAQPTDRGEKQRLFPLASRDEPGG
ncbi:hypothetical protein OG211_16160 [Streptomyces niveus]|uniref:hypothetical protein n=1 Tax=Streptomyces niveus TaxID=193462 RepID=UPI00386D21D2|nr:hypothetical protein OG211_16160 [Streptomyces niveus]